MPTQYGQFPRSIKRYIIRINKETNFTKGSLKLG